jgi:catechol 2,3-dioxygenase-like lactoylglutathione lyase family enzyme
MPPHRTPSRVTYALSRLLQTRWIREAIASRSRAPTDHPYAGSVQCDDADGRVALVARARNASLFVTDLDRSRSYYARAVGLKHLKTGGPVPHPHRAGRTIQVCALGFDDTPDLFLVLQKDADGRVVPVTDNGLSHVAFWIESSTHIDDFAEELKRRGFTLSYGPVKHWDGPGGDGGWGGNRAVYLNDPDGHFLEFSNEMDEFGRKYRIRA